MSVGQERRTIVQKQLPGIEKFADSTVKEYDFPPQDVLLSQFNTLIPELIRVITQLYVSSEVPSVDDVEAALAHDVELAVSNIQDKEPIFEYLWLIIGEISDEVEQETTDRAISYSDPEVLKKHVHALTTHFSNNLKRGAEVTNKADENTISSSRLATEINTGNPDFIIGHFLHMYWRMIYR